MKRNSRLSLALHTLSHMASDASRVRTSADIAEHAGTNPVVVRRVLGKLREAGLLSSEKGHAGGWKLAKPADSITLADIYIALGDNLISASTDETEPSLCSVETGLQKRFSEVLDEFEQNLVQRLSETKITEAHPDDCTYCDG